MKRPNLSKIVGASALALSLVSLPLTLPASAQTTTAPDRTNVDTTRTGDVADDRDFDWGWLGLLGLIGLAGLAGRKHEEPTRYRDPNEVGAPGSRY